MKNSNEEKYSNYIKRLRIRFSNDLEKMINESIRRNREIKINSLLYGDK